MEDISVQFNPQTSPGSSIGQVHSVRSTNTNPDNQKPQEKPVSQASSKQMPRSDASKLAEKANAQVKLFSTKVKFSYDPESGESSIVVYDNDTGQIIRRIPPEEMEELMQKMDEIAGIIFNQEV